MINIDGSGRRWYDYLNTYGSMGGMNVERVVVSQCLLGVRCRYDGCCAGSDEVRREASLRGWIPVCPEILGGLTTPRAASERKGGHVVSREGADVTEAFERGAEEALRIARLYGAKYALLKERSPSCGYGEIYDGSFTGRKIRGNGITAELFSRNGIHVYGESGLDALLTRIDGVRKAEPGELDLVCRFYGEVCAAQDPAVGAPGWNTEFYPDADELRAYIDRKELYLSLRGDRIIAAMALTEEDTGLQLHLFAVHPAFRGKHVSDEMIAHAVRIAEEGGSPSLQLDVVRNNYPAVRLYERLGFRKTGGCTQHYEGLGDLEFDQYEYIAAGENER